MEIREQIAEFLSALLFVYTLLIIAWIVSQFIFAFGVRVPYSRWANAILNFLRDVSEPWLRIFRFLPLRIGPIDFTPIVAILVLRFFGNIIIAIISP